jgi:hypothetical protein
MSEQPLTHAELDRLADVLKRCGKNAMNVEMLDGFVGADLLPRICAAQRVFSLKFGEAMTAMGWPSRANRTYRSYFL